MFSPGIIRHVRVQHAFISIILYSNYYLKVKSCTFLEIIENVCLVQIMLVYTQTEAASNCMHMVHCKYVYIYDDVLIYVCTYYVHVQHA